MIPILVLLASSGLLFFALVETAFGLLMRLPQRLEAERAIHNEALAAYLEDPLRFFVPARSMRGVLLALIVTLLAQKVPPGFPGWLVLLASGAGIAVGVGQIIPTLIVRRAPERVLEMLLPAFTAAANVVAPLTMLVISWMGTPRVTNGGGAGDGQTDDAHAPADGGAQEPGEQSQLLRSVVDFGQTLVREVMTPRPDIVAIKADATIDELRQLVREQEYSRLPVYTDNLDNIVGLVVVKDLIQMTAEPDGSRPVSEMMRPAAFVPETKRVADLLREFRQGRFQLAMVVDEYGGTAGLVTVEDVVEELVGEIRDEYDSDAEPIVREGEDAYVFSGKVGIGEMTDRLGIEIEDGGFETVGGYVLARAGRVPAVGERVDADGLEVEVLEAERRRIHKVRVRRRQPSPADVTP
ncbi:MAG: HlyC/CorC family transporter [Acidobacteria bacterium]|nr:HlyC/CorC family transporter [Acidobacteriota bacterium]